jgi:gamma-glutamylcyclotransferase (GGCT)/AIG2-like uncharacterized protein YtfP
MAHLFVYGTLMRGMRNHAYLEKATLVGPASTKPEFELMYNGSIPAARAGSEAIVGELYEVTDEVLSTLDVLEEVSTKLYEKKQIMLADGKEATIYLGGTIFNFDSWERIPNGDYRAMTQSQPKAAE